MSWSQALFLLHFLHFLSTAAATATATNISAIPTCHPTNCGDAVFDIEYPFWLSQDDQPNPSPSHCGYPDLMLRCINRTTPVITLSGADYIVTNISYSLHTLSLADSDVLGQDPNTCPRVRHNLTLPTNSSLSFTPNDSTLIFYFNCAGLPEVNPIGCLQSNGSYSYVFPDDVVNLGVDWSSVCGEMVVVQAIHAAVVQSLNSLSESFGGILRKGFEMKWAAAEAAGGVLCGRCEKSSGFCGESAANSAGRPSFVCYCSDGMDGRDCNDGRAGLSGNSSSKKKTMKIIIGSSVIGIVGFISACLVLFLYIRRHDSIIPWKKKNDENIEAFLEKYGSLCPTRYHYSDVTRITKSFDTKLGQGGCGLVFKGTLEDGRQVAVKVLSESKGNGEEFVNEVASIGRTSHVNVVSLLGFCSEGSKRALIYDFMCNGSLEKFIYSEKPKTTLGLEKLYHIAVGIARGLEYLHRGCNTRIVHFDIKPHNILLDEDFCPKISDFGLAKLCLQKDSILSMAGTRGTIGYIAPEVFSRNFGVISSKSDVYSYGMMVLEMVGGRRNVSAVAENTSEIYFPHWIYDHLDLTEDLQSCGVTTETEEIARKMILVGLWCIQTMPQNRPPMGRVIDMLEGDISDLQMPPKPYLSSPP